MVRPSDCVLHYDQHHHVDDGEDAQYGGVLEEVNPLGEAERQDQDQTGCRDYEVSVEVPGVTEVGSHQTSEGSVELKHSMSGEIEPGDVRPDHR